MAHDNEAQISSQDENKQKKKHLDMPTPDKDDLRPKTLVLIFLSVSPQPCSFQLPFIISLIITTLPPEELRVLPPSSVPSLLNISGK